MSDDRTTPTALFSPLTVRAVTFPNRVGVSPMCMYESVDGFATDFHVAHLGRFALGGAGLVVMEGTAVEERGRISHFDVGIWDDRHVAPLARVASAIAASGAVPGIQLAHAGRRASVRQPWFNGGEPITADNAPAEHGPWQTIAPSALPAGPTWHVPTAMTHADIAAVIAAWADGARRAVEAGFRFIELHGAHGYLLHEFLSPLSNHRDDEYGGSAENRARFPLEVVRAMRREVGDDIVLSYRMSSVDGIEGGLTLDDTIPFAALLRDAGIDVVDTSSGGISADRSTDTRVRRGFAFHAPFSRAVRDAIGAPVATVGLVVDAQQADLLVERGDADLVLLGRQMLDDPNWALHARRELDDAETESWHIRYGSAIGPWRKSVARLIDAGETPLTRFD